jgi:hypothetical protein
MGGSSIDGLFGSGGVAIIHLGSFDATFRKKEFDRLLSFPDVRLRGGCELLEPSYLERSGSDGDEARGDIGTHCREPKV